MANIFKNKNNEMVSQPLKYEDSGSYVKMLYKTIMQNYLRNRSKLLILPHAGDVRFEQDGTGYFPAIVPNVATAMEFPTNTIKSNLINIRLWQEVNLTKYSVPVKGNYKVKAYWELSMSNPTTYTANKIELMLYKNDVWYSNLSGINVSVYYPLQGYYYDNFVSLNGSDGIDLDVDDWFDIRLKHDGGAAFDGDVTHYGYLVVQLLSRLN